MGFSQAQRYGVVKEGLDEQFGKQTMLPRRVDGGPMRSFLLWKSRRQKRDGLRGSWRSCLRRRPGRIGMSWAGEKGPGWKRGARNSRNAFWFDDSEYFDAIAQDEECRWRRRMRPSARARHRMAAVANAHVTATARPADTGDDASSLAPVGGLGTAYIADRGTSKHANLLLRRFHPSSKRC